MVDIVSLVISIVIMILVGALAGWVASQIVEGSDYGFWMNALIGIIGAFLFGFFLPLPIGGILGVFIGALIGAIVLLFLVQLFQRCRRRV